MENKEYRTIENLDRTGNLIGKVGYKPRHAIIISCIAAGLLCLTMNWIAILLAAFIILISLFVNHLVKERLTMEIYDQYILLFDSDDNNLVRKIDYADIVEWGCKNSENAADALMLKLSDEEVVYKNTFQIGKALRFLNKVIPDKEERRIQEEKNKEKKLKFSMPKWPFKKKDKE